MRVSFGDKVNIVDFLNKAEGCMIVDLLVLMKMVSSKSEAKRMINQGAVELDGNIIDDVNSFVLFPKEGSSRIFRVGKKKFVQLNG